MATKNVTPSQLLEESIDEENSSVVHMGDGKLQQNNTTLYGAVLARCATPLDLEKGDGFEQYADFDRNAVIFIFDEEGDGE